MSEGWRFNQFKLRIAMTIAALYTFYLNLNLCWSLNREGSALLSFRGRVEDPFGALSNWNDFNGDIDPCSWFGVECSGGKVVILNLKDLCLRGTLAPQLGELTYVKSIILRNNSFSGNIPEEIGELKELEVLDLGYNNFSGPFPSSMGSFPSLSILLVDNNIFLHSKSPEIRKLQTLSEFQLDENRPISAAQKIVQPYRNVAHWRMLQTVGAPVPSKAKRKRHNKSSSAFSPSKAPAKSRRKRKRHKRSISALSPLHSLSVSSPLSLLPLPPLTSTSSPPESPAYSPDPATRSPSPMLAPIPVSTAIENTSIVVSKPLETYGVPPPSPASAPSPGVLKNSKQNHHTIVLILSTVMPISLIVIISGLVSIFCRNNKMATVKPWATGLSGQLQKAFITGVPKLKRSEIEMACEDFSNIIGSLPDCMVFKGTLSSGIEIAVRSIAVKSADDWSDKLESEFKEKIDTLSRINHKNFVNLLGYCEDQEPFARMMVLEYAQNGTLFEHLHSDESEHLNWDKRLRIAMGVAYCLEYMHQINPPIVHKNLQSSSVCLTEDYAAKISDFGFRSETAANKGLATTGVLDTPTDTKSNVYSFGAILFEMLTGRLPYSNEGFLKNWALDHMKIEQPSEMVDPTLEYFREEELHKLFAVIKRCVHPDPKHRPTMKEVTARLKAITGIGPDKARPEVYPSWWVELEISSAE